MFILGVVTDIGFAVTVVTKRTLILSPRSLKKLKEQQTEATGVAVLLFIWSHRTDCLLGA